MPAHVQNTVNRMTMEWCVGVWSFTAIVLCMVTNIGTYSECKLCKTKVTTRLAQHNLLHLTSASLSHMEQEDDDEAPPPDDKMIEAEPSHLDKHCHLLMDIEMHPPVLISSHFPDESTICFWHDQIENDDGFQQLVYHAIAKVRGL